MVKCIVQESNICIEDIPMIFTLNPGILIYTLNGQPLNFSNLLTDISSFLMIIMQIPTTVFIYYKYNLTSLGQFELYFVYGVQSIVWWDNL